MSWLSNLFGGNSKNPSNAAMPYLNQIPAQTNQYLQPYFDAGKSAINPLQDQYSKLLSDPGAWMNKIGESYQQSPGFKSSLEQALAAGNHASAAGGMSGTPQDQFQQMKMATDLSNQDYNSYLQNALSLYGQGLSGEQGLAGMGQQSGQNLADMISQALASQAGYSYAGQAAKNQQGSGMFNNILKGAGALSAFTPWGSSGGAMDSAFKRFFG